MLNSRHTVEIIVNGETVDIYSQEKLNLRMNNVIFDPASMQTKQGEYSFSFSLPATPRNSRIFSFANNSSKLGKFNTQYSCEVYADGKQIFKGTLRLSDTTRTEYKCNLVNIKVNNVEDIFGDMVMADLDWEIPFEGTRSLNEINGDMKSDVYFPLVCYGAFPKSPYKTYGNDIEEYTDLLQIDKTNKWYWESFHPSFRLTALLKKLFEQKGYKLSGDFIDDDIVSRIYLSEYIGDEQDPDYNLDNEKIGKLLVAGKFNNYKNRAVFGNGGSRTSDLEYTIQDLDYPKEGLGNMDSDGNYPYYNWERICRYDILGTDPKSDWHEFTVQPTNDYIYRKYDDTKNDSGYIYIPADGLYKISLYLPEVRIASGEQSTLNYTSHDYVFNSGRDSGYELKDVNATLSKKLSDMPIEVHLVRNDKNVELIYAPDEEGYFYPHELDARKYKVTQGRGTSTARQGSDTVTVQGTGSRGNGVVGGRTSVGSNRGNGLTGSSTNVDRYYPAKKNNVAYDPFANPNFICGVSTISDSAAFIKNGMSWNPSCGEFNQNHYRCQGYYKKDENNNITQTDYNLNSLDAGTLLSRMTESVSPDTRRVGYCYCVMELKKGDCLTLQAVTRMYDGVQRTMSNGSVVSADGDYMIDISYNLTIEPYSPNVDKYLKDTALKFDKQENGWGINLKLGNFLHNEEKASDFVQNIINTFNLEYRIDGQNVTLNKQKMNHSIGAYIDLDSRVNINECTFSRIEYPSSMQMKFSIDEEEAGAYRSIDTVEHQGAYNWKEYIDTGSEKVTMSLSDDATEQTVDSKFSYTWYEIFGYKLYKLGSREETGRTKILQIPIIAKDEDFIIQNQDASAKDGLSLKQRMWFRQNTDIDNPLELWNHELVYTSIPQSQYAGNTLDFRNRNGSLLSRFFNIIPALDSNLVSVECYITPEEYISLKNGCLVVLDNDLHYISEISGFDPTNSNRTTLKLIKMTK